MSSHEFEMAKRKEDNAEYIPSKKQRNFTLTESNSIIKGNNMGPKSPTLSDPSSN